MEWRLLAGVPDAEVRELLQVARRRTFGRNEVVFHLGDPGESLHLVHTGRFGIRVRTPAGGSATIAVRGPGDSFGELALVGEAPLRSATVTALEDAETFAVHRDDFDRLRRRHPSVNDVLFRYLVAEVHALNERLLEALYVPVEKRIVRRLLELGELYAGAGGGPPEIALTQEALADLAGTSRSTANEVLRAEERLGALELQRGRIRLLDVDALQRRATLDG